jgi:hypothetical protein
MPLTGFEWLSSDRLLQRCVFGRTVEVIANFGTSAAEYHGVRIPPVSVLVHGSVYSPGK